jgi:hypothetical protein
MEGRRLPDERVTAMRKHIRLIGCLAVAFLATACTVYKYKDLDGPALAKHRKGQILSVETDGETFQFSPKEPPVIKDGAVVGAQHWSYTVDPVDIVDLAPERNAVRLVLKDGTRFLVASSAPGEGDVVKCEAIKPVVIPLDEVVRARVRSVNAGATVLGSLAGVVLVAGALILDAALSGDDDEIDTSDTITGGLVESFFADPPFPKPPAGPRGRRSNRTILGLADESSIAEEKEFWALEWTPVDGQPSEDGRLTVAIHNDSDVPRGVDEAKIVVVDHPEGIVVPDVLGIIRSCAAPVPPEQASDQSGADIRELLAVKDGIFWRTAGGDPAPEDRSPSRDEIALAFPRPKGARQARLIIGASNTTWRCEFAREALARTSQSGRTPLSAARAGKPKKGAKAKTTAEARSYKDSEFSTLRVRLMTIGGWQTGQVLFAVGPRPAEDMAYTIDLSDVIGDKVYLRLEPPAGYWLIDHLALDFSKNVTIETAEIAPEDVDGPEAADALAALAAEDATTYVLYPGEPACALTFRLPPPKEGMKRSLFLRTVSCYETAPPNIHNR